MLQWAQLLAKAKGDAVRHARRSVLHRTPYACVTVADSYTEKSFSTLKHADRARSKLISSCPQARDMENKPKINKERARPKQRMHVESSAYL